MNCHVDIEDDLCQHYRAQLEHFQKVMQTCEGVTQAMHERAEMHDALTQLNEQLDKIAPLEAATRELQHKWAQFGQEPGPQLKAAIGEVAEAVKRLIDRLNVAESLTRQSRESLRPAISQSNRVEQMRQAYQRSSNSFSDDSLSAY